MVFVRNLLKLSLIFLDQHLGVLASCTSSPLLSGVEKLFNVSDVKGLAKFGLGVLQQDCASGKCPTIDFGSCKGVSIDDMSCKIPNVFSTDVKLGAESICDATCNDWPCTAACKGVDTGICYGSDWFLCKAGCLGISSCVHKCEHTIVDPCIHNLIDECESKCKKAFDACKSKCMSQLTMHISGDFERLEHLVSTMSVSDVDLNCTGDGVLQPLQFNGSSHVEVNGALLDLQLHTLDAGVSSTNTVELKKILMAMSIPFKGMVHCNVFKHDLDIDVGSPLVLQFNLDVDLQLDKSLSTIASVVCAGLPFCKDAIKGAIAKAIKDQLVKTVPPLAALQVGRVLNSVLKTTKCPKLDYSSMASESTDGVLV
eukprot:gnl/MRDRNA2_/MRDRNA2_129417_c0_seq1.p1 gnl/MRDRNA2_/MRDRNA2_129417_c0~~gnl/MRDRNA2_/MRDRNA2_129417_c0_seq1.p1  ORF type:complete len:369 (+),score=74.59 gnl/MRDRNA2_/MRDRNA2_129417_c0_seq1:102-1208(+)